ncbi:glycosyltransferase family 2 protein [Brevibacillus centrosporus]|uniref:glycosyltransferase family 2 protein n=1 Tax=Brevibacillus centrosporus TaxID=54910 RepID=UPI002E2168D2|nr:glycosyltransferase [Brevibacillus centrosporus]
MGTRRLTGEEKTLSVILTATYSIQHVQRQMEASLKLAPLEIILVSAAHLLGELPDSVAACCSVHGVDQLESPFSARAIGAAQARGDILLFLGEGRFYPVSSLQRFLFPLHYQQVDLMLSEEVVRERGRQRTEPVRGISQLLNEGYGHPEWRDASLVNTPHAFAKKVLSKIPAEELAHPAQAFRKLLSSGILIRTMPLESLQEWVPFQPELLGACLSELSVWEQAVIEEQVAAFSCLPFRGGLEDGQRKREVAEQYAQQRGQTPLHQVKQWGKWTLRSTKSYGEDRLSVIIPACNEERTIRNVLREVLQLAPAEIIVVVNGSCDQTARIAREHGVTTVEIAEPLGVDTGRAVGASLARGDILLFVDADFVIPAMDLYPFVRACQHRVEVALNDQRRFLSGVSSRDGVLAVRQALNAAIHHKGLGPGSMLVVPFALRRESFAPIGWQLLVCPPKAQAAAALAGLDIRLVHEVDSFARNRIRPDKNLATSGRSLAFQQILGDHIEAFQLLAESGVKIWKQSVKAGW